jgi:hypothetical protein
MDSCGVDAGEGVDGRHAASRMELRSVFSASVAVFLGMD